MRLEIQNVSKRYGGDHWGLRGFSLDLQAGVLGLLGPNGAGKSSLLRILATITRPTEGNVLYDGRNIEDSPDSVRRVLGYLPQDFGVYPNLTATEFLHYLAAAKGLERRTAKGRIEQLLILTNLTEARNRALGGFSGGMRQRVGIAQALLNDPELLIVDEPTAGLDPEERLRFRNLLTELASERIVILSSHIVSDVEATATRIAVINQGRLLADAAPEQFLRQGEGRAWEMVVSTSDLPTLRARHMVTGALQQADGVHVRVVGDLSPGNGAVPVPPRLEDVYLHTIRADRERKAS